MDLGRHVSFDQTRPVVRVTLLPDEESRLLQSTGVCYKYGVSGPFWYASGATVQILLFATLAIELKRRAPNAHTFLEVIKARYGTVAHVVFMVFGLVTNILVSLMLIVGGSATVNALTGMNTIAAIYLLPVGVVGMFFFFFVFLSYESPAAGRSVNQLTFVWQPIPWSGV